MAYTIGLLDIIHILQPMLSQNELHVTKSYRNRVIPCQINTKK